MLTQTWPLADLQQLDREALRYRGEWRKSTPGIGSTILHFKKEGGRGLRSIEAEYKSGCKVI